MVAKNYCLMILRSKNILVEMNDDFALATEETDLIQLNLNEQTMTALEHCLPKLNLEQKSSVTLFYFEHKSYQEISEATGYPIPKVKSYIQNGKRNLKILIEKQLKELS